MVRERLLVLEPDFTVQQFLASTPLVREVDRELFAEGLRLAGVSGAQRRSRRRPVNAEELRGVS